MEYVRRISFEPRNYIGKATAKSFKIAPPDSSMAKDLTADLLLTLLTF